MRYLKYNLPQDRFAISQSTNQQIRCWSTAVFVFLPFSFFFFIYLTGWEEERIWSAHDSIRASQNKADLHSSIITKICQIRDIIIPTLNAWLLKVKKRIFWFLFCIAEIFKGIPWMLRALVHQFESLLSWAKRMNLPLFLEHPRKYEDLIVGRANRDHFDRD